MDRRIAAAIVCSAVLLSAAGCSFARTRTNLDDFYQRAESVVPGETRIRDLVDILGSPPNNVIPLPDGGQVFLYTFGDAKTAGLDLILFSVSKSNVGVDTAIFTIGKDGVVEEVIYSTNSQKLDWQLWPFGDEEDGEEV
jgi:hypothetical protein